MSSHVTLLTFKFDNFETWSDAVIDDWSVCLFPEGREIFSEPIAADEERQEQPMEIYLFNDGPDNLDVDVSFFIRGKNGAIAIGENGADTLELGPQVIVSVMTRSELLDETNNILVDGALHFECLIQVKHKVDFEGKGHFYFPPNPTAMDVLDLVTNQSVAYFSIGKEVFRLHKNILTERAPILANMCQGGTKDEPILLTNVTSELFSIIICYIYGGGPPNIEADDDLLKEIIHAADYFGIEDLKMMAETILVAGRAVDMSNVVDWLLLADTKTCPLLKEYAMSYIIARPRDVLKSEPYAMLSSDLKDEIILFMHQKLAPSGDGGIRSLTVDELRRKLGEKRLDVHGSKETLMSRLEESNTRKRDNE